MGDLGYVFEARLSNTGYVGEIGSSGGGNPGTGGLLGTFSQELSGPPYDIQGTLVSFDYRSFAPEFPAAAGVYNADPNQCRFPGGLTPFQPYAFKFQTNPVRAPLAPVTLVGKSVIDLSVSGTSSSPIAFNAQTIIDAIPGSAPLPLNADVLLNDVMVVFSPDGQLDGLYFDRRGLNAGGTSIQRFDVLRLDPASTVAFNVGFVDGLLENVDDGARYPEIVPGTTFQPHADDVPLDGVPPLTEPTSSLEVDRVPNFANSDCAWITIHPLSGAVSLDTVASQPPLSQLSTYYGYLPAANSQTSRRVISDRLIQSRRLSTAGTVQ